jgi:hypothetical protein
VFHFGIEIKSQVGIRLTFKFNSFYQAISAQAGGIVGKDGLTLSICFNSSCPLNRALMICKVIGIVKRQGD